MIVTHAITQPESGVAKSVSAIHGQPVYVHGDCTIPHQRHSKNNKYTCPIPLFLSIRNLILGISHHITDSKFI